MYYNFDTDNEEIAVASLLVYVIWRSRDIKRFKITPDVYGQVERAVKSASKRAMDLGDFIEKLKPKIACSTINPRWAKTLLDNLISMKPTGDGSFIQVQDKGRRQFLTDVLQEVDHKAVLECLYKRTALVTLLMRERLEREKTIEAKAITKKEEEYDESYE